MKPGDQVWWISERDVDGAPLRVTLVTVQAPKRVVETSPPGLWVRSTHDGIGAYVPLGDLVRSLGDLVPAATDEETAEAAEKAAVNAVKAVYLHARSISDSRAYEMLLERESADAEAVAIEMTGGGALDPGDLLFLHAIRRRANGDVNVESQVWP